MSLSRRWILSIGLASVLVNPAVFAQVSPANVGVNSPDNGFWAEVITVTPNWLVVQNQRGQQFPIALNSVNGRYLLRSPINPAQIPPGSLVEAVGYTLPNTALRTGHIDVYDQALSAASMPGMQTLSSNGVPNDALTTAITFNWFLLPNMVTGVSTPGFRHVVGPIVSLNPITINAPGNQVVTVVPMGGGIYFTQLSSESRTFGRVKQGDLAWVGLNPSLPKTVRSLNVTNLVIYQGIR